MQLGCHTGQRRLAWMCAFDLYWVEMRNELRGGNSSLRIECSLIGIFFVLFYVDV